MVFVLLSSSVEGSETPDEIHDMYSDALTAAKAAKDFEHTQKWTVCAFRELFDPFLDLMSSYEKECLQDLQQDLSRYAGRRNDPLWHSKRPGWCMCVKANVNVCDSFFSEALRAYMSRILETEKVESPVVSDDTSAYASLFGGSYASLFAGDTYSDRNL